MTSIVRRWTFQHGGPVGTFASASIARRLIHGLAISLALSSAGLLACAGSDPAQEPNTRTAADSNAANSSDVDDGPSLFETPDITYPAPGPLLGFIDARENQSLNGDWHAIVDPMCVGCPGSPFGGFMENRRGGGLNLVEYDFEAAETLRVPGDWNSQREQLLFYRGPVWFYRTFTLERPTSDDDRVLLHFGGANFTADIWLDRELIGRHQGGYVPFSFDITDVLKQHATEGGEHFVIVRVDNQLTDSTVPTARTDWWPYGGLTRDVSIVRVPQAHIRNAKVELYDLGEGGRGAAIRATVQTNGMPADSEVRFAIDELGLALSSLTDPNGVATFEATADVELWSPTTPKLYQFEISATGDQIEDAIGLRTISTRGHEILLNGQRIKLRGISTHEEPVQETDRDLGVIFERRQARSVLAQAKALNANFVRLAHYPHARYMAQLADEMGLLLWAEIPVYWNIAWDNDETLSIARDQMSRLVERDWNRAAVIIWSVANETPLSQPRMDFLSQLIADVRERDRSRLVSAALLGNIREDMATLVPELARRALRRSDLNQRDRAIFEQVVASDDEAGGVPMDTLTLTVTDPLEELLDVLATNEYYGWYYSILIARTLGTSEGAVRTTMLEMMPSMRLEAKANKPLFVSEFGAGAVAGRRSNDLEIWSEDYQAAVYEAQIAMLSQSPQVAGMSPWILKDFRAMLRTLRGVQDYYNRKGLIAPDGRRKLAFEVLREFYSKSGPNAWQGQGRSKR